MSPQFYVFIRGFVCILYYIMQFYAHMSEIKCYITCKRFKPIIYVVALSVKDFFRSVQILFICTDDIIILNL